MRFNSVVQRGLFTEIFPHRFDYIYANHVHPGDRPDWQTESRHPLNDRLIEQGALLYGVRFGAQTSYVMLDIDAGSPYHPSRCKEATARMLESLEPLGLVSCVTISSSFSGGLHLYFPFREKQSSYDIAVVVATTLENAGFPLKGGQVELFPDPKPYTAEGTRSLFNAHRLPMQDGSFLLDEDFQPTSAFKETFQEQWEWAKDRNDVKRSVLRRRLKQVKRWRYHVSGKADKFLNDLNAEIELGWTGPGETNYLLGRITMRCFIFHHVLAGGSPLSGKPLVDAIVSIAQDLPGYKEFCGHQHDIEHRAQEWAHCIEGSKYFPYGTAKGKYKAKPSESTTTSEAPPTWNQQQTSKARDRIARAIAVMLESGSLPSSPTSRCKKLVAAGIGMATLYRHRDLWHPAHFIELEPDSSENPVKYEVGQSDRAEGASDCHSPPSLFTATGSNTMPEQAFSDRDTPLSLVSGSNSQNPLPDEFSGLSAQDCAAAMRAASQEALRMATQIKIQSVDQAYLDRMQSYLDSNDPILMAEAIAWQAVARNSSPAEPEPIVPNAILVPLPPTPPPMPPPITQLVQVEVAETGDLSHLLMSIDLQQRWLGWSKERIVMEMTSQFGKAKRSLLTPTELGQWLAYLMPGGQSNV